MSNMIERMAAALRIAPCRCQYDRAPNGVPLWSGVPIERKRIHHCTRCQLLEEYDQGLKTKLSPSFDEQLVRRDKGDGT